MAWDRIDRIIFRTMKRLEDESKKKPSDDDVVESRISQIVEDKDDAVTMLDEWFNDAE